MMDEPVLYSSGRAMNPNSSPDQYTNSSLMRDRCNIVCAAHDRYSIAKSRSLTPSSEF